MRVLVLGGTRFIGPPTVRLLIERGHEVTVFHRGQTHSPLPEDVRHIHSDRSHLSGLTDRFRALAPELVLDMFALTEQDGRDLVATFRGIARRVVVVSSCDVYRAFDRFRGADPGPPDPAPLTENSPLRDRLYPYRDRAQGPDDRLYSYDKILLERVVMNEPELAATVLRLPMVYGPGDYQHRLFPYLKRMDDRRPAILLSFVMAAWRGLHAYVEDVSHAICLCITDDRATGRTYHVAERESLSEAAWVQRIAKVTGWSGMVIPVSDADLPAHLRDESDATQDLSIDSSRIRSELGYAEVTAPDEAMARTVAWERSHAPESVDPAEYDYVAEDAAIANPG